MICSFLSSIDSYRLRTEIALFGIELDQVIVLIWSVEQDI